MADTALVAHLPGKHDQRSHGRRKGATAAEFDSRVASAATGPAAMRATRVNPRNPEVQSGITEYGLEGYTSTNSALRASKGDPAAGGPGSARITRSMDSAMRPSRADIVVTRGVRNPETTYGRNLTTGTIWVDHGFGSTSSEVSRAGIEFTGGRGGMRMRILVPKGTPAMSTRRGFRGDPGVLDPDEIVLGRGLKYRMVRDNGLDANGVRQIDVEVLS